MTTHLSSVAERLLCRTLPYILTSLVALMVWQTTAIYSLREALKISHTSAAATQSIVEVHMGNIYRRLDLLERGRAE